MRVQINIKWDIESILICIKFRIITITCYFIWFWNLWRIIFTNIDDINIWMDCVYVVITTHVMFGFNRQNRDLQFRASLIILIEKISSVFFIFFIFFFMIWHFIPYNWADKNQRHFARIWHCERFPPTRLRRSRIGASQGRINVRQYVKGTAVCKQPLCFAVLLNIWKPARSVAFSMYHL